MPVLAYLGRTPRRTPSRCLRLIPSLAAALVVAPALAMPADPADPATTVPPPKVASALDTYQRWAPPPARSWREVNDNVTRIGGWRVYLREANQPDAPATPSASGQGAHGHHPRGGPR